MAVLKTNVGTIEAELFAQAVPATVKNFVDLARSGLYDGTKFHRIITDSIREGTPSPRTTIHPTMERAPRASFPLS